MALLAACEVGLGVAGDRNGLGLVLNAFMPTDDVVLTVGMEVLLLQGAHLGVFDLGGRQGLASSERRDAQQQSGG